MKLLVVILSAILINEGSSLLVDSNTPVHLLKSTFSSLVKDTKFGLFRKNQLSKLENKYQTLPTNFPADLNRFYNIDNNRVGKMLGKITSQPSVEKLDIGIWDILGGLFGYEPTRQPVKPHVPIPNVIYPEILLIIDYELYASFETLNQLIDSLYAFWDGVDQLYAPLNDPKFKLSIAGVLIPTDPYVFEFLRPDTSYLFNWVGKLDYEEVKQSMDSWLYRYKNSFPDQNYDVFVIMTPSRNNGLFSTTIGLASVASACNIDDYSETLNRGAIIFETSNFKDTLTAAHELGHLFGLHHDGDVGCGNNNYIMSEIYKRYNTEWSTCSQTGFRQYLIDYEPTCLYNKPNNEMSNRGI